MGERPAHGTMTAMAPDPVAAPCTADLLVHEREAIVAAALRATGRYENRETAAGQDLLAQRLDAALGQVIQSLAADDLGPAVRFAESLARERHSAGFGLAEVQDALDALEAAAWARLIAKLDPGRHARALADVSTVFGAVKDALGRSWVEQTARHGLASVDLTALASGTDR
jgi:hypothetical protein